MKGLVQWDKEYGCKEEVWACRAHLSEVIDAKSTAQEAKRQVDVAQSHTNYQMSMTAEELARVTNLNESIDIIHPTTFEMVGTLTLRAILLSYFKMQDGHLIISEVHQEDYCKTTHVIIPQAEEAERMVGMMHTIPYAQGLQLH
jgi:hypothetical protein